MEMHKQELMLRTIKYLAEVARKHPDPDREAIALLKEITEEFSESYQREDMRIDAYNTRKFRTLEETLEDNDNPHAQALGWFVSHIGPLFSDHGTTFRDLTDLKVERLASQLTVHDYEHDPMFLIVSNVPYLTDG